MAPLVAVTEKKFFQGFAAKELIWVGKISWRRKWPPTAILLPGKSQTQRSLVGYSPWGHSWTRLSDFTFTFKNGRRMWEILVLGWKSSSLIRENGGVLGTRFGGFFFKTFR